MGINIPEVYINPTYAKLLRQMWGDANKWIVAANGQSTSYNNPVGKILAKNVAREYLDKYFASIDALLPKEEA